MKIAWGLSPFGEVSGRYQNWFSGVSGAKPKDGGWIIDGSRTVKVVRTASKDGSAKGRKYYKGDELELEILMFAKFEKDYIRAKNQIKERCPDYIPDNEDIFELMKNGIAKIKYQLDGKDYIEEINNKYTFN